jgi:hypothetical protein
MRGPMLVEEVDVPLESDNDKSNACPFLDEDEWANGPPDRLRLFESHTRYPSVHRCIQYSRGHLLAIEVTRQNVAVIFGGDCTFRCWS